MTVKIGLPTNWMTTAAAILTLVSGSVLAAAMTSHFTLTTNEQFAVQLLFTLGAGLTGLAAKDANSHSTQAQVTEATGQVSRGEAPKS